ncbi:MAG: hypothetical protein ACJAR7_000325 [Polaromonas sp.]|jgi:hypothetical protein
MPMQHVRLQRGVVQNPPKYSVPKPKLSTHVRYQLSLVMKHKPWRTQPHLDTKTAKHPVTQDTLV